MWSNGLDLRYAEQNRAETHEPAVEAETRALCQHHALPAQETAAAWLPLGALQGLWVLLLGAGLISQHTLN